MKGGYKIINMKGINLTTGEAQDVSGLYEALESNYGKATLVSGMVIDGVKYDDFFAMFVKGESYSANIDSIGTLTVTAADSVTFTAANAAATKTTAKKVTE